MSVKVRIPTPLRSLTSGESLVELPGTNITNLIEELEKAYPGFKARICDEENKVRRFVNIYVNEEDIRFMDGQSTPLKDGDEVSIVPAIAGGSTHKGFKKRYLQKIFQKAPEARPQASREPQRTEAVREDSREAGNEAAGLLGRSAGKFKGSAKWPA